MTDFIAKPGAETLLGTSGNDSFIFNFDQVDSSGAASPEHDIDAGDVVNGGAGYDALWAGQTMQTGYSENFDFRRVSFTSIEELDFNWMLMQMPGKVTFNSSQFGSGLSNNLVVKGAWGDCDVTVYLDTTNFDASGWTFPTPATTTVGGVPAGTAQYGWGPYVYTGGGVYSNQQIGVTSGDTIGLIGSSADNYIVGSSVADTVSGGNGNDILVGNAGADYLVGGAGADSVYYFVEQSHGGTQGVYVNLGSGYAKDTFGSWDMLSGIEHVVGTNATYPGAAPWSDFLIGDAGNNMLMGLGGDDYFAGGAGTDYFLLSYEIEAGGYDLLADFNTGGAADYLQLSNTYKSQTYFGDYGGYGFAYVYMGAQGGYSVIAAGVTGAQLQAQTYFA